MRLEARGGRRRDLGELRGDLQPKLLRFIQTGEFARVGETATRCRRFGTGIFAKIFIIVFMLFQFHPPIERTVEEWLVSQEWPGNVRELENLLRQIVVLNDGVEVSLDMLPSGAASTAPYRQEDASRSP